MVWSVAVDAGVCDGPDQQPDAVLLWERSSWTDLPLVCDKEGHSGRSHAPCRGQDNTLSVLCFGVSVF